MNKLDWKGVGQFLAVCIKLCTAIIEVFKEAKVGIEIMGWLIEEGKDALRLACRNLAEAYRESLPKKHTLLPWMIIAVGGTTTEKLLASVEEEVNGKKKNEVSDTARYLTTMPAFKIAGKPEQITLVILTARYLGFTKNPRTDAFLTKEFCTKWSAEHLYGQVIELCEPEDGVQLRRQYEDQLDGEILWMAMERITGSDGHPHVFFVKRNDDGVRWLYTVWTFPDVTWLLDTRIVFRLREVTLPSAT